MLPTFIAEVKRRNDHDRSFEVHVWQLFDFMDSAGKPRKGAEVSPTLIFSCDDSDDATLLVRRLNVLRDTLESGHQPEDRSLIHDRANVR